MNSGEIFDDRKIFLDKPCKIGRSVAKLKPEPNNAIFDCKVLSRNHALLWEENSKYYIQDTKSSNGTFLNGTRLGKSNEDSAPYEIKSGDIIQFGVDVTENTKKVTHGCITVEIRLYNKYGEEIVDKPSQGNKVDVQTQELYQLAMFLQEAMMREEALNKKLRTIQTFIDQAKENSENGWLTLIQEDRLLSRIDYLEKQNVSNNKQSNEESYKALVSSLREEKLKIETTAKEAIEKIIVEKNSVAQQFDDLKATYANLSDEYGQVYKANDELRTKIMSLAEKNQELLSKIEADEAEMNELKTKQAETLSAFDSDRAKADRLVHELNDKISSLNSQIEFLATEKETVFKQMQEISEQLNEARKANKELEERKPMVKKRSSLGGDSEDKNSISSNHVYNNDESNSSNMSEAMLGEVGAAGQEIINHIDEYLTRNGEQRNIAISIKEEKQRREQRLNEEHDDDELNDSLELSASNNSNKVEKLVNHRPHHHHHHHGHPHVNNVKKEENYTISVEVSETRIKSSREDLDAAEHDVDYATVQRTRTTNKKSNKSLEEQEHELEMALERIEELENELSEKTKLVNELLMSKDEILNANFKSLVNNKPTTAATSPSNSLTTNSLREDADDDDVCKYCNSKLAVSMLSNASNSSSMAPDAVAAVTASIVKQDINANLDFIQQHITNLLDNKKDNEEMQEVFKNIEELRSNIKLLTVASASSSSGSTQPTATTRLEEKKPAPTMAETSTSFSSTRTDEMLSPVTSPFSRLSSPGIGIGGLFNNSSGTAGETSRCVDEFESELREKDLMIQQLQDGYDDISLRARIVSYFSMAPLILLLLAIIIAFYPTLSTITATGL